MHYLQSALAICGLLCLFVGVVGHARALRLTKEAQRWPSVKGRVIRSDVQEGHFVDGGGGSTTWYSPQVVYTYRVADRAFEGSRIAFTEFDRCTLDRALKDVAEFPLGSSPLVHYNPKHPQECVLHVADNHQPMLRLAALGVAVILAAALPHLIA